MTKVKKQVAQKTKLMEQYEELFGPVVIKETVPTDNSSLAQPSPLIPNQGFVTYGVYEDPILG